MDVLTRFVLLCVLALPLALFVPTIAVSQEAISVSPASGPAGQMVTVLGTGWREHGTRGISVPIRIGFANTVARGQPDSNGVFRVKFAIPPSSEATPQTDKS